MIQKLAFRFWWFWTFLLPHLDFRCQTRNARQRRKQLLVMRKQLKEQRPYKSCCPKRCHIEFAKRLGFLRKVDGWILDIFFWVRLWFRTDRDGWFLGVHGPWWRWEEPRLLQLFEERRQRYDLDFGRLRELKPRGAWWRSRCCSGERGSRDFSGLHN